MASLFKSIFSKSSSVSMPENSDRTIRREQYQLDGDFNKIFASDHLQFKLTQDDKESSVTIETEQWVHDSRFVSVSTKSNDGLRVQLKSGVNYPEMKVHVNYSEPLIALKTADASSMMSVNPIHSNLSSVFNLVHSGSSIAKLDLHHENNLIADMSGSSRLDLSGSVKGDGKLSISGSAQLDAIKCQMKDVEAQARGSGTASINAAKNVRASATGSGTIYYRGNLVDPHISDSGSIKRDSDPV